MSNLLLLAQQAEEPAAEEQISAAINDVSQNVSASLQGDTTAMQALFVNYAMPLVWAIIILVVAYVIAIVVGGSVRNAMEKARIDQTLSRFTGRMARYLILTFGVILALSKFGIDVTAFAVVLAAAGFAIGMALSGTLSNFAAGVMLMIFRPFKVGQVITAAGITAKVEEIELFTTTFDTPDNRRIIVPNSAIFSSTIENISFHKDRRIDVPVRVSYAADLDETRAVLEKAANSLGNIVQGDGRGAAVFLASLGDSAANWAVRAWVPAAEYWPSQQALTRAVKLALDEAGIDLALPQMDLRIKEQPTAAPAQV